MPINLTNTKIKDTFVQLLHVDGGPEATPKIVRSATGTATALKVGTDSVEVDNVRIDGNVISTTDTDGDLELAPDGAGSVVIPKVEFSDAPQARTALGLGTMATQDSGAVSITGGAITNVEFTGSFTGITLIESEEFHTVNGGDGLKITDSTILADGTGVDIDINITPKGAGEVNIPKVDVDGGAIDGTAIGATTAESVRGTSVTATASLGYAAGAGGTVTQVTSKSTPVTLDKLSGRVTTHNAQLNRDTSVSFVVNNSLVAASDVIVASIQSGATLGAYEIDVDGVAAGAFTLSLRNHLANIDLSEAVAINFVVIKGVLA